MTSQLYQVLCERPEVILYRFVDVFVTGGRLKFNYVTMTSENLPNFLKEFWGEPELMQLVDDVRELSYDEHETNWRVFKACQNAEAIQGSLCLYMNWRMKRSQQAFLGNRTDSPDHRLIKWVTIYALAIGNGSITVHEPYANAVKERSRDGVRQFVLSRMLQSTIDYDRRLLSFTTQGDLSKYIDGYFYVGLSPDETMSYTMISKLLSVETNQIMLVTTKLGECEAATKAGCMVIQVKRPQTPKDRTYQRVKDMSCISLKPKNTPKVDRTKSGSRLKKSRSLNKVDPQRGVSLQSMKATQSSGQLVSGKNGPLTKTSPKKNNSSKTKVESHNNPTPSGSNKNNNEKNQLKENRKNTSKLDQRKISK
ncbi:hypothetical protein RDWZM_005677 [Blomia tropicalis]|uniref:Uncharacterized protein n=1 Tax=Blomia tropicalis TaxID=40697 RepID=A0A9Q0RMU7_BLOTA|nr:hypothetical protein RDWZM_005677 [Blomia tropicalis]